MIKGVIMPFKDPDVRRAYYRVYCRNKYHTVLKFDEEFMEQRRVKARENKKKYAKKYPNRIKFSARKYYLGHKERLLQYSRAYYQTNKERIKQKRLENKKGLTNNL